MKLKEIKALVDSIGAQFLPDYESLFTSEITAGDKPRFSLKINQGIPNEPAELTKSGLIVRICTDFVKSGEECKEIGINGRFIFDKFARDKVFFRRVYLTTSKGKGFVKAKKIVVDHFDCPVVYDWFIDEPHFATVLNFYDLPNKVKEEKIRKFVSCYFEWIASPVSPAIYGIRNHE